MESAAGIRRLCWLASKELPANGLPCSARGLMESMAIAPPPVRSRMGRRWREPGRRGWIPRRRFDTAAPIRFLRGWKMPSLPDPREATCEICGFYWRNLTKAREHQDNSADFHSTVKKKSRRKTFRNLRNSEPRDWRGPFFQIHETNVSEAGGGPQWT